MVKMNVFLFKHKVDPCFGLSAGLISTEVRMKWGYKDEAKPHANLQTEWRVWKVIFNMLINEQKSGHGHLKRITVGI